MILKGAKGETECPHTDFQDLSFLFLFVKRLCSVIRVHLNLNWQTLFIWDKSVLHKFSGAVWLFHVFEINHGYKRHKENTC